jgi:glycosyltransferase involved in cell wall biosynthesis
VLVEKNIKILRLVLNITETSGAYYLFTVPMARRCKQQVLSLFRPTNSPNPDLNISHAEGSARKYFRMLRKMIFDEELTVVHAHSPHVGVLLLLVMMLSPKARKFGKIFSVHYSYGFIRPRNRLFLLPVFLIFDRIVFCSEASRDSFPLFYRFVVKHKSEVINNGIDVELINQRKRENQNLTKKDVFKIVSVGRLEKIKQVDRILEAVSEISSKKIHLAIVGDGSEMPFLKDLVSHYKLEPYIEFVGELPREEVYNQLHNSDLFISASSTEGHPVSVIEALAAGCPILLSNIDPHLEIAKMSTFIPVFDADNLKELVNEILRIQKLSDEERKFIGYAGKILASEKYSLKQMTDRYMHAYQSTTIV